MKEITTAIFTILVTIAPINALSMSHGQKDTHLHAQDKAHEQSGHGAMASEGLMYIVGDVTVSGVKGMAHLEDVREAMAKMNLPTTHHFMIAFVDEKTGEQIDNGKVALKIKDPDGDVSKPVELVGMQDHFGADIVLQHSGEYEFMVGTELTDGAKRTFDFQFEVK